MTDNTLRMAINGEVYELDPDDLELGEVELLEEEMGAGLDEIDFTRAKAMKLIVYLMLHRKNGAYTLEDAAQVKLSAVSEPNGNGSGPTKAAKAASRAARTKTS